MLKRHAHKVGAVLYVVWGLLHLRAAYEVYQLASQVSERSMVSGRIVQDAWNLGWIALFAIVVAIWLNWRNSSVGYWSNLVVVSLTDIGFILTILLPGYVALVPGLMGPITWILAVIFSTIGFLQKET